jgi:hypothetical protein
MPPEAPTMNAFSYKVEIHSAIISADQRKQPHDCSQLGATIYLRCAFERARIIPPWRLDAHAHRLGRELFVICAEPLASVLE